MAVVYGVGGSIVGGVGVVVIVSVAGWVAVAVLV